MLFSLVDIHEIVFLNKSKSLHCWWRCWIQHKFINFTTLTISTDLIFKALILRILDLLYWERKTPFSVKVNTTIKLKDLTIHVYLVRLNHLIFCVVRHQTVTEKLLTEWNKMRLVHAWFDNIWQLTSRDFEKSKY